MSQCTVAGCGGTIEDGYCVICGMPPAAPSPSPASGSPASGSGASNACAQPGCAGTIVDGYCDECGSAAAAPAAQAPPPGPSAGSAPPDGKCRQPGCSGTIVDGYCDECGSPPDQPSAATGGTGTTGTTRTGSTRTGSSRSSGRRGMLGAGLVEVPRVPYRDPSSAVMSDPQVAESKRYCSNCGEPVGRGRPDRPGRTEGFCPKCGTGFSFTPKLASGDLVANQYRVLGCIAHGGLGWIYLAQDERVSNRWVVLKGLLDTGDADARIAAEAERAYLAAVDHPNIVKIYNFVEHQGDDYIVMQYVGGQSLKDILLEQPQPAGEKHLPLPRAIAYGLEVLRAFDYLHANGLVYCDFKPDNVIQSEEELKLIDLGGVRRLDDPDGAIYGTIGYQAPEIADVGPSVSSDLYTVGRALAVLSFPFRGYTREYAESLPPRDEVPLLREFESYDRFLRRAVHKEPAERFQDAAEMAEQLTGVLREVLAAEEGAPRPAPSALFGPERFDPWMAGDLAAASALPPVPAATAAGTLPVPLVNGADPAAAFLAGLTALDDEQLGPVLENAPERTPEVLLALARVKIETGRADEASALLDGLEQSLPGDWRVDWFRAVALLAEGRLAEAEPRFDRLYGLLPGEAAPKLALAYCREQSAPDEAVRLFELVWRTDHGYLTAAFGLGRVHLAAGRRAAAVKALDAVPKISIRYVPAQVAAVATAVRGRAPAELSAADLVAAGERLEALDLDDERHDRLAAEILEAALDWLPAGSGNGARGGALMGAPLAEAPLRRRLERTYREMARRARSRGEARLLIDSANAVRPRTLL
ncbi:serine/threonine protein kinase [Actinomadura verrucosospora]|uniref:non-specific serine/threonine protein kinase n=2 Tax=Actinomadura verrucosospora TaxID=46165 RepID=A0A7D3ZRY1_ACTVE|nr:serine/threonine protein kinase [Actinomadura verrucosospora]